MIADFSFWKPEGLDKVKSLIILVPPSQCNGKGEVKDKEWQKFATQHNSGLIGCHFEDADPSGFEGYCDVGGCDSGRKLLDFAQAQVNPPNGYVTLPPLFLFGFSAGGQFNYEFAVHFPNYVKGFVVNKGGVYYTALAPQATRKIPSLWLLGTRDAAFRQNAIKYIHEINCRAGASWDRVDEWSSHEIGDSERLSREFFATILKDIK